MMTQFEIFLQRRYGLKRIRIPSVLRGKEAKCVRETYAGMMKIIERMISE
jgi:hypothetical protein